AMGIQSYMVNEAAQVRPSLQAAFAHDGPALINIMTDPNALAMPPKVEFEQVKGMALSMAKMVLSGRMDEVLDTVKANYKHIKDIL
ncbi:MAG: ubiquinone-dependent pyruvate dehydrogenase, partial [Sphingobacteriales bacterium]